MLEFVRYSFLWFFGAFCGWLIEIIFRRFISQKKWVNPGFLSGPCVPLYGFGTVGFFLFDSMPWMEWIPIRWCAYLCELLFIAVILTLIEWIAGIIFVKGMRIKLWNYSRLWGNIQGIICPLFSLIWMVVGAGYVFILSSPFVTMMDYLVQPGHMLYTACTVFFCYGIFIVDFGYNLHIVSKVRKFMNDRKVVVDWEKFKLSFNDQKHSKLGSISWFFPFGDRRAESNFSSILNNYFEKIKDNTNYQKIVEYNRLQRQEREKKVIEEDKRWEERWSNARKRQEARKFRNEESKELNRIYKQQRRHKSINKRKQKAIDNYDVDKCQINPSKLPEKKIYSNPTNFVLNSEDRQTKRLQRLCDRKSKDSIG